MSYKIQDYSCSRVEKSMESLDGLWKDKKGRVLVQLHVTRIFVRGGGKEVGELVMAPPAEYALHRPAQMVECTLRVVRGHDIEDHADDMTLMSVLPKHSVVIMLTSIMKRHPGHYWRIEGLVANDASKLNVGGTFEKS